MSDTKSITQPAVQPFAAMFQGPGSNQFAQIATRSIKPAIDDVTGDAVIADGGFMVFIDSYSKLTGGLRVSTHKLLDACIIKLTALNHYQGTGELVTAVSIPLDEYANLIGKTLTKNTIDEVRKRVKEDLEALYSVSIEWTERRRKKVMDYAKMRLLSSQGIQRGCINVGFSPEFASYLRSSYVMQYPKALLLINERIPSSYFIGRKLLLHYGNDNNLEKGTFNKISVRALLKDCRSIPSYEKVMSEDRALDRRIKEPFQTALSTLDFISWNYLDADGVQLTEEQYQSITYYDLVSFYVKFEVKDFPDQSTRLAARAEEKAEAKEIAKARALAKARAKGKAEAQNESKDGG